MLKSSTFLWQLFASLRGTPTLSTTASIQILPCSSRQLGSSKRWLLKISPKIRITNKWLALNHFHRISSVSMAPSGNETTFHFSIWTDFNYSNQVLLYYIDKKWKTNPEKSSTNEKDEQIIVEIVCFRTNLWKFQLIQQFCD